MLVHCNAGVSEHCNLILFLVNQLFQISRAPSVVIAFLILCQGLTFSEAFETVKSKRDYIKPNEGFIHQLRHLSPLSYK